MINKKCHVFTPAHIVDIMLDEVGYIENLYGKSFLENSCGTGHILCEAVNRYIKDCRKNKINDAQIRIGLENDFFAVEYDALNFEQCKRNLDLIIKREGLENVNWNIVNEDFLVLPIKKTFDYIVGNPPYISYTDISKDMRADIRKKFVSCEKGKFDYCYPFIELSLKYLSENGKMAYLLPNNIFKTVFGKSLRNILLDKIKKVLDYKDEKIFKGILTSSAVVICEANKTNFINYCNVKNNDSTNFNKKNLGDKWIFGANNKGKGILFSEFFIAASSVATLLNEAFVIKEYQKIKDFYVVNNIFIEKELIKPAASPRSLGKGKEEMIIFPYTYQEGVIKRFDNELIAKEYPGVIKHLLSYKKKLEKRNLDNTTNWFEYGRTQALNHINREKLLMSSIITKKVAIYELGKETVPYSGIYIVPKSNIDLSKAKEILESEEFLRYVKNVGIQISGSSIRITVNDIKNFDISKWRLK